MFARLKTEFTRVISALISKSWLISYLEKLFLEFEGIDIFEFPKLNFFFSLIQEETSQFREGFLLL